ncbi:Heat shock protein 16 [Elsinoe australis]|uniref:Heat shock protein 16 n=1 Tax=Elsinoe australis TaxID=40998 RepID=A0A2P7ZUU6_9PEZI|nr:Heat shock protein 16 [Elsinoe australis]
MNFNAPPQGFDLGQLWNLLDENVRNNIPDAEGRPSRARRSERRGDDNSDEMAEQFNAMFRQWGMPPWMNLPRHGGPPHRGPPHHGPPHHGSAPPPPPPGHEGPPPPPGHAGPPPPPPPPPPGHEGPQPPPAHHGPPPPPEGGPVEPPSRSPTPPTPPTPPEELPEYPGLPHGLPHHGRHGPRHGPPHGHRGKGKGPGGHHEHEHPHGPEGSGDPFEAWGPFGPRRFGRGPGDHGSPSGRPGRRCRGGRGGRDPWWMQFIDPESQGASGNNPYNLDNLFSKANKPEDTNTFKPDVDVFDKPDRIVIFASLPGAKKSDLDVTYEPSAHSVTISGVIARPDDVDEEMMKTLMEAGRRIGYFTRTISLPGAYIDADDMTAKLEDGVLRVDIPKPSDAEWEEVRKVPIL